MKTIIGYWAIHSVLNLFYIHCIWKTYFYSNFYSHKLKNTSLNTGKLQLCLWSSQVITKKKTYLKIIKKCRTKVKTRILFFRNTPCINWYIHYQEFQMKLIILISMHTKIHFKYVVQCLLYMWYVQNYRQPTYVRSVRAWRSTSIRWL